MISIFSEYDGLAAGITGSDDFDNLDRRQEDTGHMDTTDQTNKTKHIKNASYVKLVNNV